MRLEVHWQGDDAWYLGTEAEVSGDVVPGRSSVLTMRHTKPYSPRGTSRGAGEPWEWGSALGDWWRAQLGENQETEIVIRSHAGGPGPRTSLRPGHGRLSGRGGSGGEVGRKPGELEPVEMQDAALVGGQVTFVLGKEKGRQQVWTKRRPAILLTAVRGSRELLEVWASHRGSVEPTDSFWRLLGESRAQGPGSLGETWLKHAFGAFSCTAPLLSAVHGVNRSDWTAVADEHMRRNFGWLATMQQTMRLTGYSLATADFEAV
ncbi:hypothetical protein CYMTET_28274 [Cymbomonas tetramitiformis]|uniref:Uncharacterized protein n=1 Tax=Cymbomonas tetramitiformis TaxID=36881 RepID=A0AAE0FN59_9CHLO|nr:hypothetical protein CYMTET_28274 [Cymbomonas tetramitiformis]